VRNASLLVLAALTLGCGTGSSTQPAAPATASSAPRDAQHEGITGPHGDHLPHHGGMVLMNDDIHYEVVLASDGRHQVWFSDAMRNDLPASIASGVTMEITRPAAAPELVQFVIDEAGEAWVATARPVQGDGVMVKVRYSLQGEPHEIEVPFIPSTNPSER
jgi:hypothetical protein